MPPSHLLRLSALAIALAAPAAEAAICRVAPAGTTGANGASWSTPMSLQAALGNDACNEIWVRKGLYKPVIAVNANNPTQAERAVSFVIRPGKRVYGGFAGTEVLRDARNPQAHRSVLSGDIGNDDTTDADGMKFSRTCSSSNAPFSGRIMNIAHCCTCKNKLPLPVSPPALALSFVVF